MGAKQSAAVASSATEVAQDHRKIDLNNAPQDLNDLIEQKFIQDTPIVVNNYDFYDNHVKRKLEELPERFRATAHETYYRRNEFHFSDESLFCALVRDDPAAKVMRRIGTDVGGYKLSTLARDLKKCTQLEQLDIGVDEAKMVAHMSKSESGYQRQRMRPQDIPFSLNLVVLRIPGMQALRQLHIADVKFTPCTHGGNAGPYKIRTTGSIPGGVLEKIVLPDMMRGKSSTKPKSRKRKADEEVNDAPAMLKAPSARRSVKRARIQTDCHLPSPQTYFRFLDLPPELRNRIYRFVLANQGAINPTDRIPSSGPKRRKPLSPEQVPHSVLALLQTNKQIYEEAVGVYYSENPLVFYYPLQCIQFLDNLSTKRKFHISDISLWYKSAHKQGNLDIFDFAVLQISRLTNLKQLEIVLDDKTAMQAPKCGIPGEKRIRELCKKDVKVSFRCPEADLILWHNFDDEGVKTNARFVYKSQSVFLAKRMRDGARSLEDKVAKEEIAS